MRAVIVIPARWASSRFPGKPLAPISGMSLIQRVWNRVRDCRLASRIIIATDDERIRSHTASFGAEAVMTPSDLPTGTDRIAAAIRNLDESFDQVINVQGDEPLIEPPLVDTMIETLQRSTDDIVTLASPLDDEVDFLSRDVVKVVTTLDGRALYFSRSPIPHGSVHLARRHVGVYGYQTSSLLRYTSLSPSPLEAAESLEQLRALQNGFTIRVIETPRSHLGVDRPEDVLKVERELVRLGLS